MEYKLAFGLFLFLSISPVVNGRLCYSCSYYENEIKRDYECVTSPANVTTAKTVSCPDDSYCFTKTQYYKDALKVRSITRGCGRQVDLPCGRNCCSTDNFWRTCLSECKANNALCNNQDKTPTVGPRGGSASLSLCTWSMALLIVSSLAFKWTSGTH